MKMPINSIQCWFLSLLSCSINRIYSSWLFSSGSNFFFHLASRAPFQSSCSVMSDSFQPHGLQHARLPCPSLNPGACSNPCPWSQWCHPTILSSDAPFSCCHQSFPASWSFPMSQFFASGGPSIIACEVSEVKVAQSCLTLCDPTDYTALGILQARILEWVAFPFSRGSFQPRDQTQVSRIAGRLSTS